MDPRASRERQGGSGTAPLPNGERGAEGRATTTRSDGEAVVGGAVVPEDLPLALLGDGQPEEGLHRPREFRIAVWEIRRENDAVVADGVDHVLHRLLVAFHRHEALPLEVRAR